MVFKACCVSLLGELGRDYQLQPHILPLIWRALVDYGSAWVRAKAIQAAGEMFLIFDRLTTRETLWTQLSSTCKIQKLLFIKLPCETVSRHPSWFDEKQSFEVLKCLNAHLHVYRDEKYQLDDICPRNPKNRLSKWAPQVIRVTHGQVCFFRLEKKLVDVKIAEELIRYCKPDDEYATLIAKDIGVHLASHDRDHYNDYAYSERLRMFEWLQQLPKVTYQRVTDHLLASARELAKRDAWEACHFASLFTHYRMFQYEQSVLETVANALPEEPRHETFRTSFT